MQENQLKDDSPKYLRFEDIMSVIHQAVPLGLNSIKLTGGEPLLHPDIEGILVEIIKLDICLTMETNGALVTERISNLISKCKNPFVSLSIDGPIAEVHEWMRGVKGCFEKTIVGAKHLRENGINIQLIMTLINLNKNYIHEMILLSENLGAKSLKINVLQPSGRAQELISNQENVSFEELIDIGEKVENEISKKSKINIFFDHPPAFQPFSKIINKEKLKCGACTIKSILGVLPDGSFSICGVGSIIPELKLGHVSKDKLQQLWSQNILLNELRDGIPSRLQGVCKICIMKSFCMGGCIAQNYYDSRNLWSPFWYCQKAYDMGLFPESRLIG